MILRYHSVGEPREVAQYLDPGLSLAPDRFRAQLRLLKQRCEVVPLESILTRLEGPRPGRLHVALTFDDGYRDNHDVAAAILRDEGLTATFYIATGALTSGRGLWISELWRLVPRLPDGALDLPTPEPLLVPAARDEAGRTKLRRTLTSWLASLTAAEREHALDRLAQQAGVPRGDGLANTFLSPELLRSMRRMGMSIGAHTRTHPHLDLAPPASHDAEVSGSKQDLEQILGEPILHFAYPNPGGSGLAGDIAREAVVRGQYQTAVTSQSRPLGPQADRLRLPRLGVYAGAQEQTLFRVIGRK